MTARCRTSLLLLLMCLTLTVSGSLAASPPSFSAWAARWTAGHRYVTTDVAYECLRLTQHRDVPAGHLEEPSLPKAWLRGSML